MPAPHLQSPWHPTLSNSPLLRSPPNSSRAGRLQGSHLEGCGGQPRNLSLLLACHSRQGDPNEGGKCPSSSSAASAGPGALTQPLNGPLIPSTTSSPQAAEVKGFSPQPRTHLPAGPRSEESGTQVGVGEGQTHPGPRARCLTSGADLSLSPKAPKWELVASVSGVAVTPPSFSPRPCLPSTPQREKLCCSPAPTPPDRRGGALVTSRT